MRPRYAIRAGSQKRRRTLCRLLLTFCLWSAVSSEGYQAQESARIQVPRVAVSPELVPYLRVRTIVGYSQRELLEFMPELKSLDFASSQDLLQPILQKTGETVEEFFRDFPNTTAVEDVYQERIAPGGGSDEYLKRKYHYVISANNVEGELGLEEYRTNLKDEKSSPGINVVELQGVYLTTSGHATAPMYFHPKERPGCVFRYLGRERGKEKTHAIAFAQNAETTQMTGVVNIMGTEIVLLRQGVAWIDPESNHIVRMRLDMLLPRDDVGINQHTAWIDFKEIQFDQASRSYWLPYEVRLTIRCKGWTFKNRHRYSQYKVFSVESKDGQKRVVPK